MVTVAKLEVALATTGDQQVSGALNQLGQQVNATGKQAGAATQALGVLGTAAIGAFAAGVSSASQFQSAMEMIHTQAGASQQEVQQMSAALIGMSSAVGTGPEALADAMYHIESAGFRGQTALNELRIAAEGAKVGGANLTDVTNALNAVMVAGGSDAKNLSGSMGELNAIVGAGDMKMQDLADAMGTGILATASAFGLKLQDVGAALAVFGDNNIRGSEAATKLRMAISMMGAPSAAAQKSLAGIGITSTELGDDMRNGGIISALTDLQTHLTDSGKTATQQAQILSAAFGGGKTSSAILILLQQLDRLKQKYGEIGQAATRFGSDWAATQETTAFQTARFHATIDALGVAIGSIALGPLNSLLMGLTDVVAAFLNLPPSVQKVIEVLTLAASAFFALKTGLGGLLPMLSRFIPGIQGLAPALADLAPILLGAAAAAGVFYLAYRTNFLGVGDLTNALVADVKKGMADFSQAFSGLRGAGVDPFNAALGGLVAATAGVFGDNSIFTRGAVTLQAFGQRVTEVAQGIGRAVPILSALFHMPLIPQNATAATAILGQFTASLEKMGLSAGAAQSITTAMANLREPLRRVMLDLQAGGQSFLGFFKILGGSQSMAAFDQFRHFTEMLFGKNLGAQISAATVQLRGALQNMGAAISQAFGGIGAGFSLGGALDGLTAAFGRFVNFIHGTVLPVIGHVFLLDLEGLTAALDYLAAHMDAIKAGLAPLMTAFADLGRAIGQLGQAFSDLLQGNWSAMFSHLGNAADDVGKAFGNLLVFDTKLMQAMDNLAKTGIDALAKRFPGVANALSALSKSLGDNSAMWGHLGSAISDALRGNWGDALRQLGDAAVSAGEAFGQLADAIGLALLDGIRAIDWSALAQWIITGLNGLIDAAVAWLSNAVPSLSSAFQALGGAAHALVAAFQDAGKLIADVIHGDWGKAFSDLGNLLTDVLKTIGDTIAAGLLALVAGLKAAWDNFGSSMASGLLDAITGAIDDASNAALGALQGLSNAVMGWLNDAGNSAFAWVVSIAASLKSDVLDAAGSAWGWITRQWSWLSGLVGSTITQVASFVVNLAASLVSAVLGGVGSLWGWIVQEFSWLAFSGLGAVEQAATFVLNLAAKIVSGVLDGVADVWTWIASTWGWLAGGINAGIQQAAEFTLSLGAKIVSGVLDGVADLWSWVASTWGWLTAGINVGIQQAASLTLSLAAAIVSDTLGGVVSVWDWIKSQFTWLGALPADFSYAAHIALHVAGQVIDEIGNAAGSVWGWIVGAIGWLGGLLGGSAAAAGGPLAPGSQVARAMGGGNLQRDAYANILLHVAGQVLNEIKNAAGSVWGWITGSIGWLTAFGDGSGSKEYDPKASIILTASGKIVADVLKSFASVWKWIVNAVGWLGDFGDGSGTKSFSPQASVALSIAANIASNALGKFKSALDWVESAVPWLASALGGVNISIPVNVNTGGVGAISGSTQGHVGAAPGEIGPGSGGIGGTHNPTVYPTGPSGEPIGQDASLGLNSSFTGGVTTIGQTANAMGIGAPDFSSLIAAFQTGGQQAAAAFGAGLQSMLAATVAVMNAVTGQATMLAASLMTAGQSAGTVFADSLGTGLQSGLAAMVAIAAAVTGQATSLAATMGAFGLASGSGWAINLGAGLQSGLGAVVAVFAAIRGQVSSLAATLGAEGSAGGSEWAYGLGAGLQTGLGATSAVAGAISGILYGLAGAASGAGSDAGYGFAYGLGGGLNTALGAASGTAGGIASILSIDLSGEGANAGYSFAAGLASAEGAAYGAAAAIAAAAVAGASATLGIHSPSTVMRKKGVQTGEGFELGVRDTIPAVAAAMRDLLQPPASPSVNTRSLGAQMRAAAKTGDTYNIAVLDAQQFQDLLTAKDIAFTIVDAGELRAVGKGGR